MIYSDLGRSICQSKKNTGKTNEDRPPNRNVENQSVGVLEADPVNSDVNKKILICKICTSLHKDENVLLIHLLMFHFKVSTCYFWIRTNQIHTYYVKTVHKADPVNSDINEKICKICSSLHSNENRFLIHLVLFHFEVCKHTYVLYFSFIFHNFHVSLCIYWVQQKSRKHSLSFGI